MKLVFMGSLEIYAQLKRLDKHLDPISGHERTGVGEPMFQLSGNLARTATWTQGCERGKGALSGPDDAQRQEGARRLWHRRGWPTFYGAA
jgi:hypothetical protein